MTTTLIVAFAAGVFSGNFLVYAWKGEYLKGFIAGCLAAILFLLINSLVN